MAEKRRSGRGKKVPNHPLVEALASDPSKPPERSAKLFGFPGPAPDADSTRLWLNEDLTSHVDIPNDAILHSKTLENDRGTVLWVDSTATLTYSSAQSQEVQADFLGGGIAERNLAAAVPPPGAIAMAAFSRRGELSIVDPPCLAPITIDQQECPSHLVDCTTPRLPCPQLTVDLTCPPSTDPSVCRESIDVVCPSTPRAGCPPPERGDPEVTEPAGRARGEPLVGIDPRMVDVPARSYLMQCYETNANIRCVGLHPSAACFSAVAPCISRPACP